MYGDDLYYKHSGAIGGVGPIAMLVTGVLVSVIAGIIYGFATVYIPFVYINFFITLFYGAATGASLGYVAKLTKVRSTALVAALGFAFGLFALYTAWFGWIMAISVKEGIGAILVLNPFDILSFMSELAAEGAWSIFGWTPKGFMLYVFWFLEAVIIVGVCSLITIGIYGDKPFCERCGVWVDDEQKYGPFEPIATTDSFKQQLERGDMSGVMQLKQVPTTTAYYSEVLLNRCATCNQLHLISVQNVTVSTDSDGKPSTNEDTFVQHLLLKPEQHQALQQHLKAGGGTGLDYGQSAWSTADQTAGGSTPTDNTSGWGATTGQGDQGSSPFGGGPS